MSTVMITGGSRGIGAAAVRRFSDAGHRVFFLYQSNDYAAQSVAAATGATPIRADVSCKDEVVSAFERCGRIDILVCNAGISRIGLMSMMDEDDWDRIFDVNVKGMYHCINAAMPGFLEKQSGSIVTVSSMWGQIGGSCETPYSATKGAVISMTKALAKELGPSGIRVNCVAPGVILTDMCADLDEATLSQLREETPIGRNGTPEDVAEAIEFLANAAFITGQVLGVNGGLVI